MRLNLKRLGLLAGKAARMFAARAGLTPQRIDLMLQMRGARFRQAELADRLCVTRCVVSRMLDALVELGLVVRRVGESDRRERYPELTPEGRRRLALCFPARTSHGAQDHGEIMWLGRWRTSIAALGIRVDSILESKPPTFFASLAAKPECRRNPDCPPPNRKHEATTFATRMS